MKATEPHFGEEASGTAVQFSQINEMNITFSKYSSLLISSIMVLISSSEKEFLSSRTHFCSIFYISLYNRLKAVF